MKSSAELGPHAAPNRLRLILANLLKVGQLLHPHILNSQITAQNPRGLRSIQQRNLEFHSKIFINIQKIHSCKIGSGANNEQLALWVLRNALDED